MKLELIKQFRHKTFVRGSKSPHTIDTTINPNFKVGSGRTVEYFKSIKDEVSKFLEFLAMMNHKGHSPKNVRTIVWKIASLLLACGPSCSYGTRQGCVFAFSSLVAP